MISHDYDEIGITGQVSADNTTTFNPLSVLPTLLLTCRVQVIVVAGDAVRVPVRGTFPISRSIVTSVAPETLQHNLALVANSDCSLYRFTGGYLQFRRR